MCHFIKLCVYFICGKGLTMWWPGRKNYWMTLPWVWANSQKWFFKNCFDQNCVFVPITCQRLNLNNSNIFHQSDFEFFVNCCLQRSCHAFIKLLATCHSETRICLIDLGCKRARYQLPNSPRGTCAVAYSVETEVGKMYVWMV